MSTTPQEDVVRRGSSAVDACAKTVFIALCIVALAIGIVIVAAFLLLGAKIVNIEGRSFRRALLVVLLAQIPGVFGGLILNFIPVLGTLLSFVAGFIISAALMVLLFKTSFGKALLASFLAWVFSLIVVGGIALLAFVVLTALGLFASV